MRRSTRIWLHERHMYSRSAPGRTGAIGTQTCSGSACSPSKGSVLAHLRCAVYSGGVTDSNVIDADRVIAVLRATPERVRVLLAQDAHHASHAKRIIRKDPSRVEQLDGVHGIQVTVIEMSVAEWNELP